MSEILDLAKSFEQKSKQQASDTEKVLRNEFKRHEHFISEALNSSEQTISDVINARNERLMTLFLKGWAWMGLSILLIFIVSAGALWLTGQRIASNLTEIEKQGQTLQQIEAKTFGLQLREDRKGRFIILPPGYRVADGWTVGERQALKLVKE